MILDRAFFRFCEAVMIRDDLSQSKLWVESWMLFTRGGCETKIGDFRRTDGQVPQLLRQLSHPRFKSLSSFISVSAASKLQAFYIFNTE